MQLIDLAPLLSPLLSRRQHHHAQLFLIIPHPVGLDRHRITSLVLAAAA
jgi:hypothetical protein